MPQKDYPAFQKRLFVIGDFGAIKAGQHHVFTQLHFSKGLAQVAVSEKLFYVTPKVPMGTAMAGQPPREIF
ncbi:hypothetical protein PtB15_5B122 [Puccinia triticina]|nr:hypothetical protein PtB15_5B122 [Puccinia triticina]